MSDVAEFWHELFTERVDASPAVASARAGNTLAQTEATANDAARALELSKDDVLLDIGCAKGLLAEYLRPLVGRYVGIDYVAGFHPHIVADAMALPFRDAMFDKTLLAGVLLHIPAERHPRVLAEMRRVTRVGGLGFVASNPFKSVHPMSCVFDPRALMDLALASGWAKAWFTPLDRSLNQYSAYFDMAVQA